MSRTESLPAGATLDPEPRRLTRLQRPFEDDVETLGAIELQCLRGDPVRELARKHAHADQV